MPTGERSVRPQRILLISKFFLFCSGDRFQAAGLISVLLIIRILFLFAVCFKPIGDLLEAAQTMLRLSGAG